MSDELIVRMQIDQKPSKKFFPKSASTITGEALQKEIAAIVVDMKTMLDSDLVKRTETV